MIENILGWTVMLAFPIGVIFGLFKFKKYRERKQVEKDEQERQSALSRAKRDREMIRNKLKEIQEYKTKTATTVHPKVDTAAAVRQPAAPVAPVTNWSDDLLTTMIISDMLNNNKDVVAGTVKWDGDVPTITETSSKTSFGFDDDDSRKSSLSSFSSSDSSSSWSDSSSSSSDSGPSSDW